MTSEEALRQLKYCHPIKCRTPSGIEFEIQSLDKHGLIWYRTRPRMKGCLNNYSRLSDSQMLEWLGNIEILTEKEATEDVTTSD